MASAIKLKETYVKDSVHGAYFTGGNVEWIGDKLICQNVTCLKGFNINTGSVVLQIGSDSKDSDTISTFAANCIHLVTSHKSGLLKLWTYNGELRTVWKSIHKHPIIKMTLNDVNILATGSSDGLIRIWDTNYHTCTHCLRGCQGVISMIIFHPTEDILFAAGDDAKIYSWKLNSSEVFKVFTGHFSKVTDACFSCDNKQFITCGRDKVIIIWDLINGISIKTIPVFESLESIITLPNKINTPNGKFSRHTFVATAGEKGNIRIWNVDESRVLYEQTNSLAVPASEEGGLSIIKLLYNRNENAFCIVTVDHNIIIYKLKTFICMKQFIGFSDEILDACFIGKNDSHLAVATNSPDIKIYENFTMNCMLLKGHTDLVLCINKTSANPNILASCAKDNSIRLWMMDEQTKLFTCFGVGSRHTGSVGSVALTQTTVNFVVSVSQDTCIKLWKVPTSFLEPSQVMECLRTEIAHQKDINSVVYSPNDKLIATGSQDKTCKLWNENIELLGVLRGHKRGIWCVKFSPIDQVVATSSADCSVKLWSIKTFNCLKTYEGHEASVLKLDFLSNGWQLVTAGADGLIKLYNLKNSDCTMTLGEHEGKIWALAIKSDDSVIISGGQDSLLIKWKDVTEESRLEKVKMEEEIVVQEQELNNLIINNDLVNALSLSLLLQRPLTTFQIMENLIKNQSNTYDEAIKVLSNDQKESLLKLAISWNTNSKFSQLAQSVMNVLIKEIQRDNFRSSDMKYVVAASLPYTERHFNRLNQLMQGLHFINYTIHTMESN